MKNNGRPSRRLAGSATTEAPRMEGSPPATAIPADIPQDGLKEAVDRERKSRIERCTEEINKVLQRYRCAIQFQEIYRDGVQMSKGILILSTE